MIMDTVQDMQVRQELGGRILPEFTRQAFLECKGLCSGDFKDESHETSRTVLSDAVTSSGGGICSGS
jgi:hypothetical protein